jgi:hypothetical protein
MIRRSLSGLVVLMGLTGCGGVADTGSTATEYKNVVITQNPDGSLKLSDGNQTVNFSSLKISDPDSTAGTVKAAREAIPSCCDGCSCDDNGCICAGCGPTAC